MRVAICVNETALGGVGTSTYILANGLRDAGHQADILATGSEVGDDYERARRDGWPVEAICAGERWLRRQLELTLGRLSSYDAVIANHSMQTQLVLPSLPSEVIRISVVRGTDAALIEGMQLNSRFLDAVVGISPQVSELLRASDIESPVYTIANAVLVRDDVLPSLEQPLHIVFLGRLEERHKNVLILPEIAHALANNGVPFTMSVIGDGADGLEPREKAERMGSVGPWSSLGRCRVKKHGIGWANRISQLFPPAPRDSVWWLPRPWLQEVFRSSVTYLCSAGFWAIAPRRCGSPSPTRRPMPIAFAQSLKTQRSMYCFSNGSEAARDRCSRLKPL